MPEAHPKRPNSFPSDAPPCDPQLPIRALQHRIDNQLIAAKAFSQYNVTAWLLVKGNSPEYIVRHNRTIKAAMKQLEESGRFDRDNPARLGIHSEVFVADELSRRLDVLRGETVVKQMFTERIPCSECRKLLSNIPGLMDVPRYFYLTYHDKEWQQEQADGKWGVFLMNCYRL